MHVVLRQHVGIFPRVFVKAPAIRRLLGIIQPVKEHIQVASADNLPPRQRTDGVNVLLSGQKHVVAVGVFANPVARRNRVGGKELIAGNRLAPQRQRAGKHARPQKQPAEQRAPRQARQPLHDQRAVIRGQNHGKHEPDVKQLVVVVFVGLKENRFGHDVNRRHAQHNIQITPPAGAQTRADDEDERQTRVFHPEPEIEILESVSAAVVHPVKLEPQRAALQRLFDGVAHQLRQGQRQHHAQGRALDGAAHPGIGVIRRVGQGGLLVHHQLRFAQDQAVHLGIHVDDGAEDVIGVLGAGAFHCQDEEAGVLDGGGGDDAVEIGDAQSLEQQLLHAVGGQQIGEGVRHLLGGGFVVILAVAGEVGAAHKAEVHGEHRLGAVHGAEAAVAAPAHQGGAQHHQGQAHRPQARQGPEHPPQQDGQVDGLDLGIGMGRMLFHSAPHCVLRAECCP